MLLFSAVVAFAQLSTLLAQDVLVTVEQGTLRGAIATGVLGSQYVRFLGVPYAEPPLGELRFQAPRPAPSWEGVRDALEEGPACVQVTMGLPSLDDPGDEDCLYVNVYVPLGSDEALPVFLWVPGGGFIAGSGSITAYGPDLFIDQGVLVVAVNYRVSALGFLSTGDGVIPGNAGLKDQRMAMRWVQQNIAAFGGDPARVTLAGQSAGGCSVSHHLVAPSSAGLFRAVTIQSGDSVGTFGIMANPREKAFRLGEVLGFSTNDSQELFDFLRTQNATELVAHDSEVVTDAESIQIVPMAWLPVVEPDSEGAFITVLPANNLKAGIFSRVPIMEGVTSADGLAFAESELGSHLLSDPADVQQLNDRFVEVVGPQLHLPTADGRREAALLLKDFYFGQDNITMEDAQAIVDMSTDLVFAEPADSAVRVLSNFSDSGPLYYYQFDYRGPEIGNSTYGAPHGAEIGLLFVHGSQDDQDPDSVYGHLRTNLVRLWTNFVKYGTPSPEGEEIEWEPFTSTEPYYMHITDGFELSQNVNQQRMDFWHQNIPL